MDKTNLNIQEENEQTGVKVRWSRSSTLILSVILAVIGLVIYIWWPLVQAYALQFNPDYPIWLQIDWLLVAIFLFMSILITIGADIRRDASLALVGFVGGFLIESWGTHTGLWSYYTGEKPPLWILPAWPIAAIAIERMVRICARIKLKIPDKLTTWFYSIIFIGFILYMVVFTQQTWHHPYTLLAISGVIFVSFTSRNKKVDLLTFLCGAALGYFLEVWGTTRECWSYYTLQKPPLFAVLAHGFAFVAFFRMLCLAIQSLQWVSKTSSIDKTVKE